MNEEQMLKMFGEDGLKNLKSHAELLNMSLATFVFMSQFEPVELLKMLQNAYLKQKQEQPETAVR
jgi:hypothetical protein